MRATARCGDNKSCACATAHLSVRTHLTIGLLTITVIHTYITLTGRLRSSPHHSRSIVPTDLLLPRSRYFSDDVNYQSLLQFHPTGNNRRLMMPGPALKGTVSLCGTGPGTNTIESSKTRDLYRITVMGAAKVGKTAIINQFLYDNFVSVYKATVEELHKVEYDVKTCPLTLEILDTSGAYQFPAMRQLYISKSDGFILVYSVDNDDSFNEVQKIRDLILEHRKGDAPIVVVGNKADVDDEKREVTKEVAEILVSIDWESAYIESSAKSNRNIVNIFSELFLQANIDYSLSSAVEKRRKSLPAYTSLPKLKDRTTQKRNSCAMQ